VVLTEALAFPGIKGAAGKLNVRLVGVATGGEGIDPDALKSTCEQHKPKSPLANLIPERSYLAVSLSKCIAPALRLSYLLVPDATSEQVMRSSLQATMQMPPPQGASFAIR
jgi:DNA-binding transcriptional MocR family regulator